MKQKFRNITYRTLEALQPATPTLFKKSYKVNFVCHNFLHQGEMCSYDRRYAFSKCCGMKKEHVLRVCGQNIQLNMW
jgi:hypothetical protein